MSEEVYSVEHAAARLKLHVKTVLRFIREGRLRATKVGKAYRILRSDLDALAGVSARPPAAAARVISVIDLPDMSPERAERLSVLFTAARMGVGAQPEPMQVAVAHDPVRRQVKVVIDGSPGDTAAMLRVLQAWLEA